MTAAHSTITLRLRCVNAAACPVYDNGAETVLRDAAVDLQASDAACWRLLAGLAPTLTAAGQNDALARPQTLQCRREGCRADFTLALQPREEAPAPAPPRLTAPAPVADLPLLRRLDVVHAQRLTDAATLQRCQDDQPLTAPGEPLGCLYLVSAGTLGLYASAADVRPLQKLTAGECFGLWELLTGAPARVGVRTLGPATVWRLRRSDLAALLRTDGEVREGFSRAAAEDLARAGIDWAAHLARDGQVLLPLDPAAVAATVNTDAPE